MFQNNWPPSFIINSMDLSPIIFLVPRLTYVQIETIVKLAQCPATVETVVYVKDTVHLETNLLESGYLIGLLKDSISGGIKKRISPKPKTKRPRTVRTNSNIAKIKQFSLNKKEKSTKLISKKLAANLLFNEYLKMIYSLLLLKEKES